MKFRVVLALASLVFLASGCATKLQSVALSKDSLDPRNGKVGVVMTKTPKPDTSFPGAGCLLCYAAASVANSSLTTHANTLSIADVPGIQDEITARLRARHIEVVSITEPLDVSALPSFASSGPGVAVKDFTVLRKKYDVDRLVVIQIGAIGFIRNYASYIPTSDPMGYLAGTGSIVNLGNNAYEWYLPVVITKGAAGAWDESPKYPGLTNAYYQAIEIGKDRFVEPFAE